MVTNTPGRACTGQRLRIAVWNTARRAPTGQLDHLAHLSPDVAVLPELGHVPIGRPDGLSSFVEFGPERRVGMGVASWGPWTVTTADVAPISGGVIGAVEVDGPLRFNLVAVWADLSGRPRPTVNPVTEGLDAWSAWLDGHQLVVAGDFNSGGQWTDLRTGPLSHYAIVEGLEQRGLQSAYHVHRGVEQGDPEDPTHWHSNGNAYTIDHIFIPSDWTMINVVVGAERPWRSWSDHAPVIADIVGQ